MIYVKYGCKLTSKICWLISMVITVEPVLQLVSGGKVREWYACRLVSCTGCALYYNIASFSGHTQFFSVASTGLHDSLAPEPHDWSFNYEFCEYNPSLNIIALEALSQPELPGVLQPSVPMESYTM